VDPADVAMLEDLIVVAVADAQRRRRGWQRRRRGD
jgi:DNA-binding protein YbaB